MGYSVVTFGHLWPGWVLRICTCEKCQVLFLAKFSKNVALFLSAPLWLCWQHYPCRRAGRGPWGGQVKGVWLLWFVPRRCWQHLCLTSQQRCWDGSKPGSWEGGWWCLGWVEMSCLSHPNPFQGQGRSQSSPMLRNPQCWLEPDPSGRGSAFCGVRRARCEAFQLPQLGTGTLAKARPSLAICLPSVDGTGALFPRSATRGVAPPVHRCCSVPWLGVPNACARAGEARGEDVPCRVQADVICAGALSTAWGCSQSSGSLCSVQPCSGVGCGGDAGGLCSLLAPCWPLASESCARDLDSASSPSSQLLLSLPHSLS